MMYRIVSVMALLALVCLMTFPAAAPAAPPASNGPVTASANAAPTAAAAAEEHHPQIQEAIGALRHAKEHMEHAAHDFGGHRGEALRATDEAIRQLEICLKYDKD